MSEIFDMLRRLENGTKKKLNKARKYVNTASITKKLQSIGSTINAAVKKPKKPTQDKAFTSAFGQEIEIDMGGNGASSSGPITNNTSDGENSSSTYGGV